MNWKLYTTFGIAAALAVFFGFNYLRGSVTTEEMRQISAVEMPAETAKDPESIAVYADGILIKNDPLLKPGAWYVGIENEGKHVAVELVFDENSICAGRTASGICAPDIFIEDRPVHVEGVIDGDAMRVLELTFTRPVDSSMR